MDFEIGNILKVIRRRIWFIAAMSLVSMAAAGYFSLYILKPEYEAEATILVQGDKQQAINSIVEGQKLITTYAEIIQSNRIASDVIGRLGLSTTPEKLLKSIKTRTNNNSLLTTISAVDTDPKRAADLANGFAETFNESIRSIIGIENVQLLDKATVPLHPIPIKPKPYFNMAAAFGLAFMASIGISILLELSEKPVKDEKEIELEIGLPVLGVVGKLRPLKRESVKKIHIFTEGANKFEEENTPAALSRRAEQRAVSNHSL